MTNVSATAMVIRYRKGEITLDALAADFATREWHESSWRAWYDSLPEARRWHEADGLNRAEPGTWGEVKMLYDIGELTADEYYALADAVDTAHGIDEYGNDIAVGDAGR